MDFNEDTFSEPSPRPRGRPRKVPEGPIIEIDPLEDFSESASGEEPNQKNALAIRKPREAQSQELKKNKGPVLKAIDFEKSPIENLVPISERLMSRYLGGPQAGWDISAVKAINLTHGIFTVLPQICNPDTCSVHACGQCSVTNREDWRGNNCPIDIVEGFKLYVSYINDLAVKKHEFTDLMMVADLVTLHLRIRRLLFDLKTQELQQDYITAIANNGKKIVNKVSHVNLKAIDDARKEAHKILEKLMASRADKFRREKDSKIDEDSVFEIFSKAREIYDSSA
jgi:hypothetical protein